MVTASTLDLDLDLSTPTSSSPSTGCRTSYPAAGGPRPAILRSMTPLDDARYISLLSFKRDGAGVATPVWAAPLDGRLVAFTNRDSYKVKRIGRNPKVRVAPCDARGKLLGPWLDGTCTIAGDPAQQLRIMEALGRKYGWQIGIVNFFARLSGRAKQRAYLEIAVG